jgi:hypothetical protein
MPPRAPSTIPGEKQYTGSSSPSFFSTICCCFMPELLLCYLEKIERTSISLPQFFLKEFLILCYSLKEIFLA